MTGNFHILDILKLFWYPQFQTLIINAHACLHMQTSTSIRVSTSVRERLKEFKVHPNESFDDVIDRLLNNAIDEEPLSDETIKAIEESLEDLKAGRVYTLEEIRNELR